MLLTYSFPKFKDLILSGEKIHTIRADPHRRWRVGMSIQHWMGSPRNVKSNPHEFATGECKAVQDIHILRMEERDGFPHNLIVNIIAGPLNRSLNEAETLELIKNDGLTVEEFMEWFVPESSPSFRGRTIHFTDKLY